MRTHLTAPDLGKKKSKSFADLQKAKGTPTPPKSTSIDNIREVAGGDLEEETTSEEDEQPQPPPASGTPPQWVSYAVLTALWHAVYFGSE